jgi:lipopolysaccharide export LptBFGC system permease protein LptF
MADTQRYWDGERWTDHIAPGAPAVAAPWKPSPEAASTAKLETWGMLGAFFFPIVGIVIGIMLISRPGRNQGGLILGISFAVMVVASIVLVQASSQPQY